MTKGDRTRQFILEKAAPVFNRKGYAGTALADVMQATGLQKGGIYRHFASKEDLAADAFDYAWSLVSAPRFAALQQAGSAIEQLQAMVSSFAEHPATSLPGGCPLLNTAIESDDTNPVLRARSKAALAEWTRLIAQTVEQGITDRQIRPDAGPSEVAVILIATLEGALMISKLQRDRDALQRARRHLLRFLDSLRV